MAITGRPSAETRFLIEIDGVTGIVATDATPGGVKHTPVKYKPGNARKSIHLPGDHEFEEFSFKHAEIINDVGRQLLQWLLDYSRGVNVTPRTLRRLRMDESGITPVETLELRDCIPTMYKPESSSGTGTGVASFSFSVQPDDIEMI
ncbi:MAG: hypothetical protein AUG51_07340 [Acidobacteria bacterium 13_1_20CM_3_53_8]|nr:MAG: hypothetical protein AUG51_07340 [Acidobacteria bacterium 13_1_20CM_3_53_8]